MIDNKYDEMKNLFDLKNKVAIVTGAAQGIGQGIAFGYSVYGGKIMCTDIKERGLENTVNEINRNGGIAEYYVADVTDINQVRNLYDETIKKFERIDTLYIVPSINFRKKIEDYSYEEFDKVINVNLKSAFILMKEIGTKMKNNENGGSIIILSSIRSLVVEPGQSVYAATKAGVLQLARTFASEMGKYNIRVNAIGPGVVDTPLTSQIKSDENWYKAYAEKTVFKRWAAVKEIVGPAIFLATDASSYITGSIIYVDGGWTAIDGRYEPKV